MRHARSRRSFALIVAPLLALLAGCGSGELGEASGGAGGASSPGATSSGAGAGDASTGASTGASAGGAGGSSPGESASQAGPSGSSSASGASGGGSGGEAEAPLRIAVLSDLNGSYGSTTYEESVHAAISAVTASIRPDLVLVTGDMVAGQKAGLDYAAMWKGFHAAATEPLHAAGIPIAVTPGNHDASAYPGYEKEREIFEAEWKAKGRVPPVEFKDDSRYPLRYSFVHKGVFFLSLDATTIGPLSAEQRGWVAAELAAAKAYPVKIAFGHVPLHAVTKGRETEILGDDALEQIFRDGGLTLYLSGHHHGYYPGARKGLRLVSTSCLGGGPRALIGTDAPSPRSVLEIVIEDGAVTSLEALRAPDYAAPIKRSTLPASVGHAGKSVDRDDLAGF